MFALPSLSEDDGSTKPTIKTEVHSFHETKLLDRLQKSLPDYQLRRWNSLYKAPESVQVSVSRYTYQELPVIGNFGFKPRKLKEMITKLKDVDISVGAKKLIRSFVADKRLSNCPSFLPNLHAI